MNRLPLLIVAALALPALAPAARAADQPLHVGAAQVDITPPVGYRMAGSFTQRISTAVNDPLYAKALVLRQGPTTLALVTCDLLSIGPEVSAEARRLVYEKLNIPPSHIAITATHTHAGPLFFGSRRNQFHAQALARLGHDPHEAQPYPPALIAALVDAISAAHDNLAPASLELGSVRQHGISFNRRYHMRDGSVRMNPGVGNQNIIHVAGPIDPELAFLLARHPQTRAPLVSLSVFALHNAIVGGSKFSADFPAHLAASLQATLGDQFLSLFAAGTCGDINHVDVLNKNQLKGHELSQQVGQTLAEAFLETLPRTQPIAAPRLAAASATIRVPMKQYTPQQIADARQLLEDSDARRPEFLDRVLAHNIIEIQERGGADLPLEVQAFRLSDDIAIVTLPGEVFVELGLAIKSQSPFSRTLVISLANDGPGYIPTTKAFSEGSYETVNSRIQPGGGEQMVQAALQLLQNLKN